MRALKSGRRVPGRRALVTAAVLSAVALAGCAAPPPPPAPAPPPPPPAAEAEPALSEQDSPVITRELVHSDIQDREVELYVARPTGTEDVEDLPVVLYLHGRDGVNPTPIPYDTLASLERLHRDGAVPPFALAVVDGGYNPYWHGDLSRVLHEELPGWLSDRGLGGPEGLPYAVAGISTGGFGALNYAADRNLAGRPVSAVAGLAPALPITWEHMREKQAFSTEQEWVRTDPLQRLADLGDVPVGLWVGDADPFLPGAEELAARYEHTPVFSVLPGGHDGSVFEVVGEDMIRFLAAGLPVDH
ncbi:alpha/beta hydrolase [Saccharopolyspora cebuensis]|uniref:Alpha/beta hydrolase n=1 Tax=Saccharopolyspora cebuensis TaxID=418759 RepID=A0ABV4CQG7_9PSEU